MERSLAGKQDGAPALSRPSFTQKLCRKILRAQLEKLTHGQITLSFNGRQETYGCSREDFPNSALIMISDPAFFPAAVFGGTIGAAESYMADEWQVDDLTALVRILVRNRHVMDGLDERWFSIQRPFLKLLHALNRNSRKGSRKNIAAHYDLGNEFFGTFLDPTLMYSCAIFESPQATLHDASVAKIRRICRKLTLQPSDHLLEIGTGWGAFAILAAREFGCRVTTTTISRKQHEIATARVAEEGLEDRITVLLRDYRDLDGSYDKLVSIEMIEAVGHQYLNQYMNKCSTLLKSDGAMLIQAITINDWLYDQSLRSVDFIKRYIFPGSFIPSISAITQSMKQATDLRLFHLEDITPHYAQTLAQWRDKFHQNIQQIRRLGFQRAFERMWDWYLCYCEGGFDERALGCVQLLFTKPASRKQPILPALA